jgi:hypothetical protein
VVEFAAPRCEPGSAVVLLADSGGLIAEAGEKNNDLRRRCAPR